MNTEEKIAIMQAYLNGETIQFKCSIDDYNWKTVEPYSGTDQMLWMWGDYDYRIKPGPRYVYCQNMGEHSLKFMCWAKVPLKEYQNDPTMIEFVEVLK